MFFDVALWPNETTGILFIIVAIALIVAAIFLVIHIIKKEGKRNGTHH